MFVNLSRVTFSPAERLDNVVQSTNLTLHAYKALVKKSFIRFIFFLSSCSSLRFFRFSFKSFQHCEADQSGLSFRIFFNN